ncbi:hypothetical protein ABT340_42170 [Streptosporangium sp. NPDC000239]|uniref:hypothetical protein n=1 Tax=Streptosporangium sp. NPDC000239 TaxID=3154248 RepID=UPI003323EF09
MQRRKNARRGDRSIPRARLGKLFTDDRHRLRERLLWRMLYETATRAEELLSRNIEDLELEFRRGRVTSKGGAIEYVHWPTGTARLLPRLLRGRTTGPLFLGDAFGAHEKAGLGEDVALLQQGLGRGGDAESRRSAPGFPREGGSPIFLLGNPVVNSCAEPAIRHHDLSLDVRFSGGVAGPRQRGSGSLLIPIPSVADGPPLGSAPLVTVVVAVRGAGFGRYVITQPHCVALPGDR